VRPEWRTILGAWLVPVSGICIGFAGVHAPWVAGALLLVQAILVLRCVVRDTRRGAEGGFPALLAAAAVLLAWSWLLGVAAGLSVAGSGALSGLIRPLAEATLAGVLIVLHARRHAAANPSTHLAA
jgi:hypothetical protein